MCFKDIGQETLDWALISIFSFFWKGHKAQLVSLLPSRSFLWGQWSWDNQARLLGFMDVWVGHAGDSVFPP